MKAILRQIDQTSIEEALSAFAEQDSKTREVVLKAAHYLGISLANMIGLLNIHKIILTGDVARFGAEWLSSVRSSMEESALTLMSQNTTLELGKLGYDACVLGAAAFLMLDDYSLLYLKDY